MCEGQRLATYHSGQDWVESQGQSWGPVELSFSKELSFSIELRVRRALAFVGLWLLSGWLVLKPRMPERALTRGHSFFTFQYQCSETARLRWMFVNEERRRDGQIIVDFNYRLVATWSGNANEG